MSGEVRYHPRARRDLVDHAFYLSDEASTETGERFLSAAETTAQHLLETPRVGRVWSGTRPETRDGLRVWHVKGFPKILIFYRIDEANIVIIRVLHSARDLPRHLEGFA